MKETDAEKLRRFIQALQPVSCKTLGEAMEWTNERVRLTAKAMVKRGHLVRQEGLLSIGSPPKKVAGQGRYSRNPQPRLDLNPPKPVQVERLLSSDEWLAQSPKHQIQRLGNGEVSKASRFQRLQITA